MENPWLGKGRTGELHRMSSHWRPEVASVTAVQIASLYEAPREDENVEKHMDSWEASESQLYGVSM